jgi:SNF2 family DNA or RNA helicase/HJR/Mrr/RecB family endonuclease
VGSMGIKDLIQKILRGNINKEFCPDFSDNKYIKVYLKEDGKNIIIDSENDEDLFVLTNVTNLSLSTDKHYLYIKYENIYELYTDNNKELTDYSFINLPDLFTGFIQMENQGNFNESKIVKYKFSFENGSDYDIKRIKNNIISVNGEYRVIPQEMYNFLKQIIAYNKDDNKIQDTAEQFELLAKIKDAAEKTNLLLNTRLREEEKPIIIDEIKLDFLENEDCIEVVPYIEAEDNEFNKKFLQKFDKSKEIKNFYNIQHEGKNRKVIFKDKSSAEKVKRNRVLKGEAKSKFCNGDNELFEDDSFDLSLYGPRVKGMGYVNYRSNSAPSNSKDESWFDFEKIMDLPKIETDEETFILTPKDRQMLQDKLQEIESNNFEIIEVELPKEGKLHKTLMTKQQVISQINGINNSIVDIDKINSVKDLEEIREKLDSNIDGGYVEFKGRYIKCYNDKYVEEKINQLKLKNSDGRQEDKKKEKVLLVKENLDLLEYVEMQNKVVQNKVEIPLSLKISLFEHQKEGLGRLQNLYSRSKQNGFLLADDMGLGKTLQILSFLAWLKEKEALQPALMVAPTTLLDNWDNEDELNPGEIQKCFAKGTFTTFKVRGRMAEEELERVKKADIVLTSYESLRINHKEFAKIHWSAMVCDEMQKAKNATTLVSLALKSQNADFKISCSATPIENTTLDLWNIMDYSVPGILGSLREFKKEYVNKINMLKQDDDTQRKQINNSLMERIENNFLRRSKEGNLKDLPKKFIKVKMIPASQNERDKIQELNLMRKQGEFALPLIQKMIALCSHEELNNQVNNNNISELINQSSKLKALKVILDEIKVKDEKVLIFSIFRRMQEILAMAIKHWYGINCSIVNGTIEQDKRKGVFNSFRNSEGFNAIVLSPEVAGVGITLTEANHVVHYTRLWNPAKEAQATDRVYRIGQKKDVYVYYPILTCEKEEDIFFNCEQEYLDYFISESTKGKTPEEKLNKLLIKKKNLFNNFFLATGENGADVVSEWDEDELKEERHINIQNLLSSIDADEFEALCSLIYQRKGYDTYLTVKSGDKGVDVVAGKDDKYTLIQCKKLSSKNITSSALREVFGAKNIYSGNLGVNIEKLVVISTAEDITQDTKEFAKINGIQVILKNELAKLLDDVKVYYSEVCIENKKRYSIEQIKREI